MDFSIQDVHMDIAVYVDGSTNMIARNIEKCDCPHKFSGLSCQDPGKGYFRWRNSSSNIVEDLIGHSIPCKCNGRSNECDRETGTCLVSDIFIYFFYIIFFILIFLHLLLS